MLNWGFPFFSPLHRDLLDRFFHLNARQRGDYLFVLARRAGATA